MKNVLRTRNLDREELGYLLHTAMRKCLDSKASSIAWNIVNIMDDQWGEYLDVIWQVLENKKFATHYDVAVVVRNASLKFDYMGKYARAILHVAFELFTPEEWFNYTYYLVTNKGQWTGSNKLKVSEKEQFWLQGDENSIFYDMKH